MPSGYQNTNAQLQPVYYRVTIDTSTWSNSNSSTAGGSIEPWDYNYFSTLNTSLANSERRARGNIRWASIMTFLEKYANCELLDVTVLKSGATVETEADDVAVSVAFTVGYYQEAYVLGGHVNYLASINQTYLSDGSTILTPAAYDTLTYSARATSMQNAIQDLVTLGITIGGGTGYIRQYRTYNPQLPGQLQENITVTQPDTPANVWAKITVSQQSALNQQYEGF
jgi:hypothetical protein